MREVQPSGSKAWKRKVNTRVTLWLAFSYVVLLAHAFHRRSMPKRQSANYSPAAQAAWVRSDLLFLGIGLALIVAAFFYVVQMNRRDRSKDF